MGEIHIEIEEKGDTTGIGYAPNPGEGRGRRLNDLPKIIVHSVNKFCVVFSNVDVFSPDKVRELRHRIQESSVKPHVIALQEVRPKNCRFERVLAEYNIDGYEIIEKNVIDTK